MNGFGLDFMKVSFEMVDPLTHSTVLNTRATDVPEDDIESPEVQAIIDAMINLANSKGHDKKDTRQVVGLAAPQVGVDKRIILIDMTATGAKQAQSLTVIINPELIDISNERVDGREGCWSCGNICGNVSRAQKVTLAGFDRKGKRVAFKLEGFVARIAQHETDHLEGIRFPDRIPENEPWRLHHVKPSEFESYRTLWADWSHYYSRVDWNHFRDGISPNKAQKITEKT